MEHGRQLSMDENQLTEDSDIDTQPTFIIQLPKRELRKSQQSPSELDLIIVEPRLIALIKKNQWVSKKAIEKAVESFNSLQMKSTTEVSLASPVNVFADFGVLSNKNRKNQDQVKDFNDEAVFIASYNPFMRAEEDEENKTKRILLHGQSKT